MKVNGNLYGHALSLTRLRRELPPGGSILISFTSIRTVADIKNALPSCFDGKAFFRLYFVRVEGRLFSVISERLQR